MSQLPVVFKRELASYFATPLAYVFIVMFLVLSSVFTFYLGGFYERGQADLAPFFEFHIWLYGRLRPDTAPELSGTKFMMEQPLGVDAKKVSPNGDPLGRSMSGEGSPSGKAGGKDQ